jgi:hypothetical protein
MGQTSDTETSVIHQKMTPGKNPEDFKATFPNLFAVLMFFQQCCPLLRLYSIGD